MIIGPPEGWFLSLIRDPIVVISLTPLLPPTLLVEDYESSKEKHGVALCQHETASEVMFGSGEASVVSAGCRQRSS